MVILVRLVVLRIIVIIVLIVSIVIVGMKRIVQCSFTIMLSTV